LKDVRSAQDDQAGGKKFCYVKFASPYTAYGYRNGAPYQEAIFSLEWTNEAEGKFWLQIVKQHDYRDPNFDYSKFFKFAPDVKG
jgi:hypothetical protein